MTDNSRDLGRPTSTDLTIETLHQVNATANELPTPTLITNAVLPEQLAGEWRESIGCVTDEAANCMRVHAEQEWNEQVVRVPERLERLLADPVVGGRVHQQHAEQHYVTRDTAGLSIVNLEREHRSNLRHLDIEEALLN